MEEIGAGMALGSQGAAMEPPKAPGPSPRGFPRGPGERVAPSQCRGRWKQPRHQTQSSQECTLSPIVSLQNTTRECACVWEIGTRRLPSLVP